MNRNKNRHMNYQAIPCVNMPKLLFQQDPYQELSADAKLLYSLILDRRMYSKRNGWVDEKGRPYVIYAEKEIMQHLNASAHRVQMALIELEVCDEMIKLDFADKKGPFRIYVRDITGNVSEPANYSEDNTSMRRSVTNDVNSPEENIQETRSVANPENVFSAESQMPDNHIFQKSKAENRSDQNGICVFSEKGLGAILILSDPEAVILGREIPEIIHRCEASLWSDA